MGTYVHQQGQEDGFGGVVGGGGGGAWVWVWALAWAWAMRKGSGPHLRCEMVGTRVCDFVFGLVVGLTSRQDPMMVNDRAVRTAAWHTGDAVVLTIAGGRSSAARNVDDVQGQGQTW